MFESRIAQIREGYSPSFFLRDENTQSVSFAFYNFIIRNRVIIIPIEIADVNPTSIQKIGSLFLLVAVFIE